jgi:IgA Peptidase M64
VNLGHEKKVHSRRFGLVEFAASKGDSPIVPGAIQGVAGLARNILRHRHGPAIIWKVPLALSMIHSFQKSLVRFIESVRKRSKSVTSFRLLALFATALLAASNAVGQTYNTMVNNGASSNRVDMIFIGDGYRASEIESTYVNHIQGTLNHFFGTALGSPLGRYDQFFNVHRVNVISNQSGADRPPEGFFVDTALDASYWWGGTERCLYFNTTKANNAVSVALAGSGIDTNDGMLLGTVNDSKYGGCGGQWGVYAGANAAANEIALHEIGHSFANLADEYFSPGTYTGSEPGAWNITKSPSTGKWDRWLGYVDPQSDIGAIGYYEGGGYYQNGLFRPSDNSKMRALNRPFDAISREKFINDIYQEVDPLDDWLDNTSTLMDPNEIWVLTVDPDVINVEWILDGISLGLLGEVLDIDSLNLGVGSYSLTARAYDGILDHAFSGDSLDWWRLDSALLTQTRSWNFTISVPEPGIFSFGVVCIALAGFSGFRRRSPVKAGRLIV